MRKLFASNKKAKKKPGDYKVPVPMVGGILNAKLTEAQIDAILTGRRNNNDNNNNNINYLYSSDNQPQQRKPSSSVSTETRSQANKQQRRQQEEDPIPARPISSPPILVMPKPRRPLRQAESVLRSQEFDKTQIESSSGESEQHDEDDEEEYIEEFQNGEQGINQDIMEIHQVMVLWPENWTDLRSSTTKIINNNNSNNNNSNNNATALIAANTEGNNKTTATPIVPLLSNKLQREQLLAAPEDDASQQQLRQFMEETFINNNEKGKVTDDPLSPTIDNGTCSFFCYIQKWK